MSGFLTRRRFMWGVAGLTGGVLVAGAGSFAACRRSTQAAAAEVKERLAGTLPEVFAPQRLARHWHATTAEPTLHEILGRPGLVSALQTDCVATRRTRVRQLFAEDFARGDVVVADRLMVSRSEYLIAAHCLPLESLA